ncbi:MAG: hypothetical protein C0480_01160 [Bradyrhizobium sp.]|nr:hypothetical protein [Bradyrhizobium sp.]
MTEDPWDKYVAANLRSRHLTTDNKIMMLVEHLQVTLEIEFGPDGGLTKEDRLFALRLVNAIGSFKRIARARVK